MNKTTKTFIKLGATLVSGTIIFLGTTEKGRSILKKNPKLCAWMEKKEKEREERRKQEEARRAEREKQRAIRRAEEERQRKLREEQRKEQRRLENLYNYHKERYFQLLRQNWPLTVDPEIDVWDIDVFDMSVKQALYNYGIYYVSGLLYHYDERSWHGDDRFADIHGIGIKRSALLVHYIQSNVKDWDRMRRYSTYDMSKCSQTFYNYKAGREGTFRWL